MPIDAITQAKAEHQLSDQELVKILRLHDRSALRKWRSGQRAIPGPVKALIGTMNISVAARRYFQSIGKIAEHSVYRLNSVELDRAMAALDLDAVTTAAILHTDPTTVRRWERGQTAISGPASALIEAMLADPKIKSAVFDQAACPVGQAKASI